MLPRKIFERDPNELISIYVKTDHNNDSIEFAFR